MMPTVTYSIRPIMASSCARATSMAESRYRIDIPIEGRRGARVIALDDGAATLVRRLAKQTWHAARFYTLVAAPSGSGPDEDADMPLHRTTGSPSCLLEELGEADVAVMVATEDGNAAAAERIGLACAKRGIMTAGIALGDQAETGETVRVLRPHARVLLVTNDPQDVAEILSSIRA